MQTLPLHLDLFALIMLLGVAQGLFLGFFFLSGARRGYVANRSIGWLMLALSAIVVEMLLCYTNYITRLPQLVDFSEPFNFVLGPLIFFFVFARLHNKLPRHWGWHLLPAGLWAVNAVSWLYQPPEVKYNNYLEAYHPELPNIAEPPHWLPEDFTGGLREYISELTLFSGLVYALLALYQIHKAYRQARQSFWAAPAGSLRQLRNLGLLNLSFPLMIALVKPQFDEDLGDYILACYITLIIYLTNFMAMRSGAFFSDTSTTEPAPPPIEPKKKYEKSALTNEDEVLTRLDRLLLTEKPYLDSTLSLPKLAAQLRTSPHHLSQLLNNRLGQPFFDWLATHRVAEAQRLLTDPGTADLKIDDIAERVGYNATSAFHTAFKRITGQTPAQFREANRMSTGSSRSAQTP